MEGEGTRKNSLLNAGSKSPHPQDGGGSGGPSALFALQSTLGINKRSQHGTAPELEENVSIQNHSHGIIARRHCLAAGYINFDYCDRV